MKTFPACTATVRQGRWVTTVTLDARSRCGDPITAQARHRNPDIAFAHAEQDLAVQDVLSTVRCRRRGGHPNHG